DPRRPLAHLGRADPGRDVLAVEEHVRPRWIARELDDGLRRELCGGGLLDRAPEAERLERQRPVVGARVEVAPSELLRDRPRGRGFPRCCGPVDRDDEAHALSGTGPLTRPPGWALV